VYNIPEKDKNAMEFFAPFIFSFLITQLVSGRKAGQQGFFRSIRIHIGKRIFHAHHWFIGAVLILLFFALDITWIPIYGLLAGVTAQGLTYRDALWFVE